MRAALHDAWPALSYHFGLMPWDVERLSPAELGRYVHALAEINTVHDRGSR